MLIRGSLLCARRRELNSGSACGSSGPVAEARNVKPNHFARCPQGLLDGVLRAIRGTRSVAELDCFQLLNRFRATCRKVLEPRCESLDQAGLCRSFGLKN